MPRPLNSKSALRTTGTKPNRTGLNTQRGKAVGDRSRKRKTNRPSAPVAAGQAPADYLPPRPPHRWTFLTNHAHVLILLKAEPELILRDVAARVGITERAVQRIIQDLESAGFIQRQKVGRQNHYRVSADRPLRHPIEAHRTIGDLLQLIHG